jgi:hypothetical protein
MGVGTYLNNALGLNGELWDAPFRSFCPTFHTFFFHIGYLGPAKGLALHIAITL